MAAQSRRADPSLEQLLFEEGYRFEFFEAVRMLERLYSERRPVGRDASPSREVVRFHSHLSLNFPPSAIHEISRTDDGNGQPQMSVAFMGLTGPQGVLPRHYTELLLERTRHKDFTLRDFLDIFNHRFISLFYRAWEKYRFPLAYERAVLRGQDYESLSLYLFDFIGIGTRGLRGRLDVEEDTLLFYAGLLAQQPHSASALEAALGDYFGVPVRMAQFTGEWLPLSKENRSSLGLKGANNSLGVSTVLGSRFWDQQAKFRTRIGPLTFRQFSEFLPSGSGFQPLVQLTRFFVGQELDFDVQLILKGAEVPYCRLGRAGDDTVRLGWSSWLKTREFGHDADDAVLGSHLTRVKVLPYRRAVKEGREGKTQ